MLYHTSPNKIEKITMDGTFYDCLFFSNEIYVMTQCDTYYVYEINEEDFNFICASDLYNEEIISKIENYFECDTKGAEELLTGYTSVFDLAIEDASEKDWWLQAIRGECAKKMGFDGCEDRDEQGTVYIIPMFGREKDIKFLKTCQNN